jgi:predicted O-linked N-acetylglucosamine transferase (SPINDLY family)
LGQIALQGGNARQAIRTLSKAIELDPAQPEYHNNLGLAYSLRGEYSAAAESFGKTVSLVPDNPIAHNNLGNAYRDLGQPAEAAACYTKAISKDPGHVQAYIYLGDMLRKRGELESAITTYRKVLAIKPDSFHVQFNLAIALINAASYQEALEYLRKLEMRQPDFPGLQNNLGLALMKLGHIDEAIHCFHKEGNLQPDSAIAYNSMGIALEIQNNLEGAIDSFRTAITKQPKYAEAHSNLLLNLNYLDISQDEIYRESLNFNENQAGISQAPYIENLKEKEKVLKIGYVSPDFRSHSVAHFTKDIFNTHNRENVETFCYSNVVIQDDMTRYFEGRSNHWLSITGMTDDAVAERIRRDKIDILVDLAGHTAGNRLPVFIHRPAPVQVSWLGYPNTTGLSTMDYRLTDAVADPPGEADSLHTEKLIRLPYGFLCYQTDDPLPKVSSPPSVTRGYVTFGSLNNLPKVNPKVIRVWSKILNRIPDARLVMKSERLADKTAREKCLQLFGKYGISPDRLDLLTWVPTREKHLEVYSGIDIGLDPFPYNGTTTTCEALWMGVPVITWSGGRHASRVGASILRHAGLPELIADSTETYIELAHKLADDINQLAELRKIARPQMRKSNLMNTALFTETLENAYRQMWLTWCSGN